MTETSSVRGRPKTGKARSNTQRVKDLDAELLASGGRILNRLRLSAAAAQALADLAARLGSDRAAIEAALLAATTVARNDK